MQEELNQNYEEAIAVVDSSIQKCEKIQPKFAAGTSQHTLLKNRLKALYVAKALLKGENHITQDEVTQAYAPIASILHKCEKAQGKYEAGTTQYNRYINMIDATKLILSLFQSRME